MLAFDSARVATSFGSGLLAAVNPCGFVLLPAYLMYFLGMEQGRPGSQRASLARALKVGAAVSSGFLMVFLIIGAVTRWQSSWLRDKAPWVSLVIAVLLVVLGVAMVFGYKLPVTTPKLDVSRKDRSVRAMFVFGVAYAIASIGCTIGPFISNVFGGAATDGFLAGIAYLLIYSTAMAVVVIGLTVSLAMANTWLLGVLRKGMQHVETVAGIVVLLSGLYLFWYWYNSLRENYNDSITGKAEQWQARLANFVDSHRLPIAITFGVVILAAVAMTTIRVRRTSRPH